MTEAKGKSGAGSAEGSVEGIMLPDGTWWRTRFPDKSVSTCALCWEPSVEGPEVEGMHLSHDESACRI